MALNDWGPESRRADACTPRLRRTASDNDPTKQRPNLPHSSFTRVLDAVFSALCYGFQLPLSNLPKSQTQPPLHPPTNPPPPPHTPHNTPNNKNQNPPPPPPPQQTPQKHKNTQKQTPNGVSRNAPLPSHVTGWLSIPGQGPFADSKLILFCASTSHCPRRAFPFPNVTFEVTISFSDQLSSSLFLQS